VSVICSATTHWLELRRTHNRILLSHSHLMVPQPGGPCPCTYIPEEQGGTVIPPDTGFPFRRLIRLAGLRRKYSNPPPHGAPSLLALKLKLNLRPTVSRPVCLGVGFVPGTKDQILVFCLTITSFLMWGALSDERTGL
jgi:hypothetical protein